MYSLIAEYGSTAISLLFTALAAVVANKLLALIESKTIREHVARLATEVFSAVREVGDGYVADIKRYSDDGKLTKEEKAMAKATAIRIAKANFGSKGIKRLARIFDVEEWLGNKVEAFVGDEKRLGKPRAGKLFRLPPPAHTEE